MAVSTVPTSVLSQQLSDATRGRRVRCAVFTTFSFDPAFFELHVLPLLFDQSFSQPDKVRRIQLEDALRAVDNVAVYYDMRALAQDGGPAQLDYRRIGVSRGTGYFHPKVVLLLVDDWTEEDTGAREGTSVSQSLVVAILSANLTRSGWWENVECAHVEELKDKDRSRERSAFRSDLLSLIRRIRESAGREDDQSALSQIRAFLLHRVSRERTPLAKFKGVFYTRTFCGQKRQSLIEWLSEKRLDRLGLNLEVISPFFDDGGAGPLEELIETLKLRETRVFLPTKPDGAATVTHDTYAAVGAIARWAKLPPEVVNRGQTEAAGKRPPRHVHAKVYRLWRKGGPDVLIVGSPNLTTAGFSHAATGNLEAAFLVDTSGSGHARRWWMEPLDRDVQRFADTASSEQDGLDTVGLDLSFQYDWRASELSYRLRTAGVHRFDVTDPSGHALVAVTRPSTDEWVTCDAAVSDKVQEMLRSTSFLIIKHEDTSWRVLVREEHMAHRPSLLLEMTPEEIFEYWSFLTAAQRADLIERLTTAELEGLPTDRRAALRARHTVFDRFSGVYHAFGCLQRHVEDALANHREREAEARLLGAKYDSLPSLLQKTLDAKESDAITRYVTFLCAKQVRDHFRRQHQKFFSSRKQPLAHLDALLDHLGDVRSDLPLDVAGADGEFIKWYEAAFLKTVTHVGTAPR